MKIFFSVGEHSGDIHGANLIRDLKAGSDRVEAVGFGGPKMKSAGCDIVFDLTALAVMGILPVLRQIRTFWKLIGEVDDFFRENPLDAVVLIDYPGFNWWVARKAKKHGIPVFYYGVPQMWGWAPWRVRKMRRLVDHALCKLPFEESWYQSRGCAATFVGHPFFDEVDRQVIDATFFDQYSGDQPLVLLLPGSRTQEVHQHVGPLLDAAVKVRAERPDVALAIACVKETHAAFVEAEVASRGLPIDVFVRRTPELIRMAHSCMACSGSVSLELMAHRKPTVIVYKVNRTSWFLQSILRRTKFITLVNLLAVDRIEREEWATYDPEREGAIDVPFPEYLWTSDCSAPMAAHVVRWLNDPEAYANTANWLDSLNVRFGQPGASLNAANYILETIGDDRHKNPKVRAA